MIEAQSLPVLGGSRLLAASSLLGGVLLIATWTGHHSIPFPGDFRSRAGDEGSRHGCFPKLTYNFEDSPLMDFVVFSLTFFFLFSFLLSSDSLLSPVYHFSFYSYPFSNLFFCVIYIQAFRYSNIKFIILFRDEDKLQGMK